MIYYAQNKETSKPLRVNIDHPTKRVLFHAVLDMCDLVINGFSDFKAPGGDFVRLQDENRKPKFSSHPRKKSLTSSLYKKLLTGATTAAVPAPKASTQDPGYENENCKSEKNENLLCEPSRILFKSSATGIGRSEITQFGFKRGAN